MAWIKGTWVLHEILNFEQITSFLSGRFTQNVRFTSNYVYFTGVVVSKGTVEGDISLIFLPVNGEQRVIYKISNGMRGFKDEEHRVLDFGDFEQEVKDEFYAWLVASAAQVDLKNSITPISEDERLAMRRQTAFALPDSPAERGMPAHAVKPAFWKAFVGEKYSVVEFFNRLAKETDFAFYLVNALLKGKLPTAHNTSSGTHVDIRNSITDLAEKHDTDIGALEGKFTYEHLALLLGCATSVRDGLMSAEQVGHLETLVALLQNDDKDVTINTIKEVLAAFDGYENGTQVASLLEHKLDKVNTDGYVRCYGVTPNGDQTTYELPIHKGGGEHAVVQNDGDTPGVDDGKSNWTNATHAAVFGNNNRVIQTTEKGNDGRNSSIGGGLGNKIYAPNSFVGAGEYNQVGSDTIERVRSAIVGGNYNEIYGSNVFIGGGYKNKITADKDELSGSAIVGGSNNAITGQGCFIAASDGSVIDGAVAAAIGYNNQVYAFVGAAIGRYIQLGSTSNTVKRTFAIGYGLKSFTDYQTLLGKWNATDTGAVLIIGGGTSDTDRKNLYTLRSGGTPTQPRDLVPKSYVDALKVRIAALEERIAALYADAINLFYFNNEIGTATATALDAKADKSYVDTVILNGEW